MRQHRDAILALLAASVPPSTVLCWNCHGARDFPPPQVAAALPAKEIEARRFKASE